MVSIHVTFPKAEPGANLARRLRTVSPPRSQLPPIPARSVRLKPLFRIRVLCRRTPPAGPHWEGRKYFRQEKRKRRKRERGLESLDRPGCTEGHKWKNDGWRARFFVRGVSILLNNDFLWDERGARDLWGKGVCLMRPFEEINYYKMEWNLFLLCLETVWLIKRVHDKEEREFSPMQGSFLDLRTSRIILPKEIETRLWETFFSSLTVHFICLLKSSTRKREKQTKPKKNQIFLEFEWGRRKEGGKEN